MADLHIPLSPQRHSTVPYLWRARCSCGWLALCPSDAFARLAIRDHIEAESPFPHLDAFEEPPR